MLHFTSPNRPAKGGKVRTLLNWPPEEVNNTRATADELVLLGQEQSVCVRTTAEVEFLVLGGTVVQDELVRYGPFVANSKSEMHQVIARYQRGAFGTISKSPAL